MKLCFSEHAWEDYLYWHKADKKTAHRINALIKDILRDPFHGSGKPEPLKHALGGYWSRRITSEHRIVYSVTATTVYIAQIRYHYRD